MSAATQLISRRHLLMIQKLTYLRQNLNHRQDFAVSLGRRLGLSTVSFRGLEPSLKNESYCEMTCIFYIRDSTQKDFPEDPSGRFDDFDHFVKSSFDTCKWIGWLLVLAQGCSVLLATVLRATEKDQGRKYDNEDDYAPQRLPFLGYPVQPFPYVVVDLPLALQQ